MEVDSDGHQINGYVIDYVTHYLTYHESRSFALKIVFCIISFWGEII